MKDVGLFLFILAGPLAYESPASIDIALQVVNIKDQIEELNLAPFVWVAEDETKIQTRLRYNVENNTIMGLHLPLDDNGMPIESSFKFTTISAVKAYIENYPKSSYTKLVTCKSLHPDSMIFVVVVYGTTGTDQS